MDGYEITNVIKDVICKGGIGLVVLLTLVQITPIKINPWSAIFKWIGGLFNKAIIDQMKDIKTDIESISKKVVELEYCVEQKSAVDARIRILRFGDEVSHGINHSRDHFQQIFADITFYNQYCINHPEFKNNMTIITAERIQEDYKIRDLHNNFL